MLYATENSKYNTVNFVCVVVLLIGVVCSARFKLATRRTKPLL